MTSATMSSGRAVPAQPVFNDTDVSTFALQHSSGSCFKEDPDDKTSIAVQFILAAGIIALNTIVLVVIKTGPRKTYRKPAFFFIGGLACTDILLALSLVVFCIISIGQYQLSAHYWVSLQSMTSVWFNASVNYLLAIAVDRLCFIGYSQRYRAMMTKRNIFLIMMGCFTVAVIPILPIVINGSGSCEHLCACDTDGILACTHAACSTIVSGFTKQYLFGLCFYFLIMLLSISFIYALLFIKVRKHAGRVYTAKSSCKSRHKQLQREFRLARTLGIVVASFFLCWSPLMILYVVDYTVENMEINKAVYAILVMPSILNSLCNPIIYAARIPHMRRFLFPCRRLEMDTTNSNDQNSSTKRRLRTTSSATRKTVSTTFEGFGIRFCTWTCHRKINADETTTSEPSSAFATDGDEPSKGQKTTKPSALKSLHDFVKRPRLTTVRGMDDKRPGTSQLDTKRRPRSRSCGNDLIEMKTSSNREDFDIVPILRFDVASQKPYDDDKQVSATTQEPSAQHSVSRMQEEPLPDEKTSLVSGSGEENGAKPAN